MLQVTTRAAAVLKEARAQRGYPETFGLRVESRQSDPARQSDSSGGLRLEFSEEPVEGDQIAETEGLRVFVSPEIAEPLAEMAIDTRDAASGADLVMRYQSDLDEQA
jgi:Fe-S cluster assembly iron-binding protein IscA